MTAIPSNKMFGIAVFLPMGALSMVGCIIKLLQINGKITKSRLRRIRKIAIPICITLLLTAALTIIIIFTSLFRSDDIKRDTTDISEYGNCYGLLLHSNLEVFPESISASAENIEYRFYNDDSIDPSSLVFLECTYNENEYEVEIARLESIGGICRDEENYNGTAYITMLRKFESEYALVTDDNTIIYICYTEGLKPKLPDTKYLRNGTAAESQWFSIYDYSNYDNYKYWPKTWKK